MCHYHYGCCRRLTFVVVVVAVNILIVIVVVESTKWWFDFISTSALMSFGNGAMELARKKTRFTNGANILTPAGIVINEKNTHTPTVADVKALSFKAKRELWRYDRETHRIINVDCFDDV